ncbi:MAG: hypothetical protein FJ148_01980 [Deltaproteobacteria bacterium]|nr:hypothetical protein [Deltaproteobacteria bacterium]
MVQDFSWQSLVDTVSGALSALGETIAPDGLFTRDAVDRLVKITYPVAPFNQPEFVAPVLGIAGVLLSLLLAGVAVSSLLGMVAALLALAMLLTRFYGVSLELGASVG